MKKIIVAAILAVILTVGVYRGVLMFATSCNNAALAAAFTVAVIAMGCASDGAFALAATFAFAFAISFVFSFVATAVAAAMITAAVVVAAIIAVFALAVADEEKLKRSWTLVVYGSEFVSICGALHAKNAGTSTVIVLVGVMVLVTVGFLGRSHSLKLN